MTVFIFNEKKLFEVNFIVPIDIGDIVQYDQFAYSETPSDNYPYPEYKVTGRTFRYEPAFSGKLIIYLTKI